MTRPSPLRCLLALALLAPLSVAAQGPGLGSGAEVGWSGGLRLGALHAADRLVPMAALSGGFRLSPRFDLSGEAVLGLTPVRVSPDSSPDRSELSLGYGGLLFRYGLPPEGDGWNSRFTVLIGAGRARVTSPLVETDIGSENFFLVEPAIDLSLPLAPRVRPTLNAGYRIVLGAEPLPGVNPSELRGFTLSLGVNLVRDP